MDKNRPEKDQKPKPDPVPTVPISTGREHDHVSFKTWIVNLFEDERGMTSIKPVIAFLGAVFLCVSMIINGIFPDYEPADFFVEAIMIITAIGMGADSIDKFSTSRRRSTTRNSYGSTSYRDDNIGPSSEIL